MSTVAIAPSPREELGILCQRLGSESAAARLLGKNKKTVWEWVNRPQKLQERSVRAIHGAALVVERIVSEHDYDATELEYVLRTPWPALGAAPAELIRNGQAEMVVAVLEQGATVETEAKEDSMSKTTTNGAAARLAEAAAEQPAPLSAQFTRFKPYDADEQFARGRIGNIRETERRPAASGRVRGLTSDEPLNW